jgi:large subunit ribosomal protein L15
MQLHNLTGTKRHSKRVGRGGKRGTYSGRGGKGQTARAGHRIRPALRDYLKQIPKRRGRHKHSFKSVNTAPAIVNIEELAVKFAAGETVNPKALASKGMIRSLSAGQGVKILGVGKLAFKLTLQGCLVSKSARQAIEKAGGKVL